MNYKLQITNWWVKNKDIIIVFFLYLVLALVFTWPVIVKISSVIYGNAGDPFYNLWVFHNLRFGDLLVNQPYGLTDLNHIIQPAQPLIDFWVRIFTYFFSDIVSYNLITILSSPISGLAIYLIIKLLTKNNLAAFFAGLVFAFSPYHLAHAQYHISLSSIYYLAFFVYFLIKVWSGFIDKSSEKISYKYSALAGVLFALTLMDNYQYGFFAGVILLIFLLHLLILSIIKNKKVRFNWLIIKNLGLGIIVVLILISAFDYKIIKSVFGQGGFTSLGSPRSIHELKVYSAEWFNYFIPSPDNPIFKNITKPVFDQAILISKSNFTEQTLYLGWISLLLSMFGIWKVINLKSKILNLKSYVWFLVVLVLVGLYLSFAPSIIIFGHEFRTPAYYIFEKIPVIRVYARFGLMVNLAMAVLTGIGLSCFLATIKNKKIALLLYCFMTLLLITEFANFPPYHYTDVSAKLIPPIYQILENQPKGIVAEYPLLPTREPKGYSYLLWQTYHKFPLVYGAPDMSASDDFRKSILDIGNLDTIKKLQKIGVKYIIIHENEYNVENSKKLTEEYNKGITPKVTSDKLEFVSESNGDILYRIL
ncbi:MAG: hypothetical protein ACD_58C00146G0011 [uncultured bacterium]|nr:MAG: hypothetical protein ACD_58C00146G0011 [uncultured bacterium]